jgi:hypothetical protein
MFLRNVCWFSTDYAALYSSESRTLRNHRCENLKSYIYKMNLKQQRVLRRTNRILSFKRHGPHWKRRVQQFFYCCVCIRYRGNVSTEQLPSSYRGIFTESLPSNDKGDTHTQTATWSHEPTLFFQNKGSRLKRLGMRIRIAPKNSTPTLAHRFKSRGYRTYW